MFWLRRNTAVGMHLGLSAFSGTLSETNGFANFEHDARTIVLRATAFAYATGYDRIWVAVFGGYHRDWVTIDNKETFSGVAPAIGAELGFDVYANDQLHAGLYLHGDAAPFSDSNFSSVAFGIAVRR